MIEFRNTLQERVMTVAQSAVGASASPPVQQPVKTFDEKLRDVEFNQLPFLVVNVRSAEKQLPGEIGNNYQKYTWTVHIYYLDTDQTPGAIGASDRRDTILARVEKRLEENKFLCDPVTNEALKTTDTDGHVEVVYDSSIQYIAFDESGQDGFQSYTAEMIFEVYTDRY